MRGTPKTLDEAIYHGIRDCPMKDIDKHCYDVIRDYLAQAFTRAQLSASTYKEEEKLEQLFKEITKRKSDDA